MYLNAVDFEVQLVKMGIEEDVYIESREVPTRRRRRVPTKKRNNSSNPNDDPPPEMHLDDALFPQSQLSHGDITKQIYEARYDSQSDPWATAAAADEDMMGAHMGVHIKMEPGLETHHGH
jgi:hypothetical protein